MAAGGQKMADRDIASTPPAGAAAGSGSAPHAPRLEASRSDASQTQVACEHRSALQRLTPRQRYLCLLRWHLSGMLLAAAQWLEKIAWMLLDQNRRSLLRSLS